MQIYQTISPKNTQFSITYPDGSQGTKTARHEIGVITGKYRDIYAVVADTTGFDGLGFDSMIGSADDNWHMVNLFGENHKYIDTVAVNGADDIDHAIHIAMSQFDYLEPQYATFVPNENSVNDYERFDSMGFGADVIQKVLDNPSQNQHFLPIITKKMLTDEQNRASYDDAMWDGINLISHGKNTDNLYMDMLKHDKLGELQERFDLKQALGQLNVSELGFDSLMDTNNRLQLMADRLYTALVKAKIDDLAVNSVELTKPFKRLGMANVAMAFGLSDGQTFTIFFHNPDSDPKKLAPQDVMVSWKWLLNKRDVTAVVSPKNGENVQLSQVAMRMMKIAHQNKKRFANAQKKIAQNEQALIDAQKLVDDKKAVVEQLDKDIADLQGQIEKVRFENANKPVGGGDVDETTDEPIELTGDEFGEFDLITDDGVKALRDKAINTLQVLSKVKAKVFCPALNANVFFDKTGIKKIKSFSANPVKLQALFAIVDLIKQAKVVKKDILSYDKKEQERNISYSTLKTPFFINGKEYGARLVVRKIDEDNYQYDLQIKDNVNVILDSADMKNDVGVSANKSDLLHHWLYDTALFDNSQSQFINKLKIDKDLMLPSGNEYNPALSQALDEKDTGYDSLSQGKFHYDLQVKDIQEILDNLWQQKTTKRVASSSTDSFGGNKAVYDSLPHDKNPWNGNTLPYETDTTNFDVESQAQLDSMANKMVLNLFVFDENGNEIVDEPTTDGIAGLKKFADFDFGRLQSVANQAYQNGLQYQASLYKKDWEIIKKAQDRLKSEQAVFEDFDSVIKPFFQKFSDDEQDYTFHASVVDSLERVLAGKATPASVVGRGAKKSDAVKYLAGRLSEYEYGIEHKGDLRYYQPARSKYLIYLLQTLEDIGIPYRTVVGELNGFSGAFMGLAIKDKSRQNQDEHNQHSDYSQDDIDYLNAIINGEIDPVDGVDFDKLEAIGEKNETDPLFEQANEVISQALDKASS